MNLFEPGGLIQHSFINHRQLFCGITFKIKEGMIIPSFLYLTKRKSIFSFSVAYCLITWNFVFPAKSLSASGKILFAKPIRFAEKVPSDFLPASIVTGH
jgi:hypothetical protein